MTDIPSPSNIEDDQQDDQQRIAQLVRSFDAPAPQSLHRRIGLLVDSHRDSRRRSWPPRHSLTFPVLAGAGAIVVVVAIALAIAVGNSGGGTPALSVGQAVAPTLRAATLSAPRESLAHNDQLEAAVDGVPFPYWGERFGWRSTGARADRINGHTVRTVFYTNSDGQRVGYAIFARAPQPRAGGVVAWRGGVSYRLLDAHGLAVVTWLRDGHLCVVAGRGVSSATLLRLASWSEGNPTVT
ncbi:MAG TPA: hypothetical protein VK730_06400 [Solirubrobacteraceae bacterium]|jgi:hypothetical protein|nr:hypothetical protein [Solirubrobacteraceae bacterium]